MIFKNDIKERPPLYHKRGPPDIKIDILTLLNILEEVHITLSAYLKNNMTKLFC